jgi:hypothetical protein
MNTCKKTITNEACGGNERLARPEEESKRNVLA